MATLPLSLEGNWGQWAGDRHHSPRPRPWKLHCVGLIGHVIEDGVLGGAFHLPLDLDKIPQLFSNLLERILKKCLPGNADLHVAGEGI